MGKNHVDIFALCSISSLKCFVVAVNFLSISGHDANLNPIKWQHIVLNLVKVKANKHDPH